MPSYPQLPVQDPLPFNPTPSASVARRTMQDTTSPGGASGVLDALGGGAVRYHT
ncbi:MAG: hypothetical protein ACK5O2_02550 [Microthrixaceae bacterium]